MARIQRNFVRGRMNKSLDERLIPNGEDIDAVNVRLGSTEDSEIGAVEKAKGNSQITRLYFIDPISGNNVNLSNNARCIGAYEDGANETLYWFIHDGAFPLGDTGKCDMIVSFNNLTGGVRYHVVSVDDGSGVNTTLNFNPKKLITGINKEGNLLFFTDDFNPPRFINVNNAYKEPVEAALVTTNVVAFAFTAGLTTGAGISQIGFHRGTLPGCPVAVGGVGAGAAPTTTQVTLPGTGCYTLTQPNQASSKITPGFGIQGANKASNMRLTEFITDISGSTNNVTTMSFFVGDGSSVSGSGNIAGNITGSDGSSGTYSCNFRNEAINQVDDSGFSQNPESTGTVVLQGLTLVDGVTYTLTL